jgi:hypothetical protein
MLHSLARTDMNEYSHDTTTLVLSENGNSGSFSGVIEKKHDVFAIDYDIKITHRKQEDNTSPLEETELIVWEAKSQKAHELCLESLSKDYVRLFMAKDGKLSLRYDVAGEGPFEINVRSRDEAAKIIDEDNMTTEQLYPDNPELKWIKITQI